MNMPVLIRPAIPEDAEALLEVYAPYVLQTAITFEYEVPSVEEFAGRVRGTLARYPYLVAERDGKIVGYAYVSAFHARPAYDWAVETSIYVAQACRGGGVGRALYEKLEEVLRRQNILNLNACIAFPRGEDSHLSDGSPKFHERLGYRTVGHFHQCGYKFDTWYDMIWMEKLLGEHPVPPMPVRKFSEVADACFA